VFARPVVTDQGKKFGTLVVIYSMASLKNQLRSIEEYKLAQGQAFVVQVTVLGLVFLAIAAGISVFQSLRITRPIQQLAQRADQIARGDLTTRVEIQSPDEIGMLAENFNFMADRLQVLLEETAAKAVLEKELELARTIQETLVPSSEVIRAGRSRWSATFSRRRSAEATGGRSTTCRATACCSSSAMSPATVCQRP
jgi:sigma-B regulation protein RsbU (phosphoserine phosphatase)